MKPENTNHEQMFLDGLQPVDIPRIIGENRQRADLTRIQQHAEGLGWLATSYAIAHREMPQIRVVRGVDDQNLPLVRIEVI